MFNNCRYRGRKGFEKMWHFWFWIVFVHFFFYFFIKCLRHYSAVLQKKKHTNYTLKNVWKFWEVWKCPLSPFGTCSNAKQSVEMAFLFMQLWGQQGKNTNMLKSCSGSVKLCSGIMYFGHVIKKYIYFTFTFSMVWLKYSTSNMLIAAWKTCFLGSFWCGDWFFFIPHQKTQIEQWK